MCPDDTRQQFGRQIDTPDKMTSEQRNFLPDNEQVLRWLMYTTDKAKVGVIPAIPQVTHRQTGTSTTNGKRVVDQYINLLSYRLRIQ